MTNPHETDFQVSAKVAVLQTLNANDLTGVSIDYLRGSIPFYSPEPMEATVIRAEDVEIWLFDDEAAGKVKGKEVRFERGDYQTTNELTQALVSFIERNL